MYVFIFQVTVLLQCFREDADNLEATNDIIYNINDYNRHFSGEPRAVSLLILKQMFNTFFYIHPLYNKISCILVTS